MHIIICTIQYSGSTYTLLCFCVPKCHASWWANSWHYWEIIWWWSSCHSTSLWEESIPPWWQAVCKASSFISSLSPRMPMSCQLLPCQSLLFPLIYLLPLVLMLVMLLLCSPRLGQLGGMQGVGWVGQHPLLSVQWLCFPNLSAPLQGLTLPTGWYWECPQWDGSFPSSQQNLGILGLGRMPLGWQRGSQRIGDFGKLAGTILIVSKARGMTFIGYPSAKCH